VAQRGQIGLRRGLQMDSHLRPGGVLPFHRAFARPDGPWGETRADRRGQFHKRSCGDPCRRGGAAHGSLFDPFLERVVIQPQRPGGRANAMPASYRHRRSPQSVRDPRTRLILTFAINERLIGWETRGKWGQRLLLRPLRYPGPCKKSARRCRNPRNYVPFKHNQLAKVELMRLSPILEPPSNGIQPGRKVTSLAGVHRLSFTRSVN
jgi:hypothetical protein